MAKKRKHSGNKTEKINNQSKSNHEKSLQRIKAEKFMRNNMIVLVIIGLIILLIAFSLISTKNTLVENENKVFGDDVIEMHYFYLTTCAFCIEQDKFHPTLEEMYPNLKIIRYDTTRAESQQKIREFADKIEELNIERISTPTTIIGSRVNVGFGSPETTGQILINMIEEEMQRINENWDDATMTRTIDLRAQQ